MAVAPPPSMDVLALPKSVRLHSLPLVVGGQSGRFLSLAGLPPCAARPQLRPPSEDGPALTTGGRRARHPPPSSSPSRGRATHGESNDRNWKCRHPPPAPTSTTPSQRPNQSPSGGCCAHRAAGAASSSSSLTGNERTEAMSQTDADRTRRSRRRRRGQEDDDWDGRRYSKMPPLITIPSLTLSSVQGTVSLSPPPPVDDPEARLGLIPFPSSSQLNGNGRCISGARRSGLSMTESWTSSSGSRSAPCSPSTGNGVLCTGSELPPSPSPPPPTTQPPTSVLGLGLTPLTCYTRAQPVPTYETPPAARLTLLRPDDDGEWTLTSSP